MASHRQGEYLSQLARLLFDSAATKWYSAIVLDTVAGVLTLFLAIAAPTGDWALLGAGIASVLILIAYALRLVFEDQYETAETMRRQAAMTEALGCPADRTQESHWKQRAGGQLITLAKQHPREPDYYTTSAHRGVRRLAEMTIESAFYTRHVYSKIKRIILTLFLVLMIVATIAAVICLSKAVPERVDVAVARAFLVLIPYLLSANLLGWFLRLNRAINTILAIERELDRLLREEQAPTDAQVLHHVAEYNCQLIQGFPIHPWLFRRWHREIRSLWEDHQASSHDRRKRPF